MKHTFTLSSETIRASVMRRIRSAPVGWRVTIDEGKRSDEANARFHAALGEFAKHAVHPVTRTKLSIKTWKSVFLAELAKEHGVENEIVPTLDGSELITVGQSTSELSVRDFSDLTELLYSEGARQGIVFYEPRLDPDWTPKRARKPKRAGLVGVSPTAIGAEAGRAA